LVRVYRGTRPPFVFYEVFNDFALVFKYLLLGKDASQMSSQATKFLNRKGTLEQKENRNVLMIFGSKENPSFLPCHITDKMFVAEIARKYNHWLHFFNDKKNKTVHSLCPGKLGTSCAETSTRLTNLSTISRN
jgi:hypothetical protein